jgi:hypothetical protein
MGKFSGERGLRLPPIELGDHSTGSNTTFLETGQASDGAQEALLNPQGLGSGAMAEAAGLIFLDPSGILEAASAPPAGETS